MRVLVCHDCKTVEPLPDAPKGINPNNISPGDDPLLDQLLVGHRFPNGEEHVGNLLTVDDERWYDPAVRDEIFKELNTRSKTPMHSEKRFTGAGVGGEGLGKDTYALRDTFQEDAMKCFRQHGRPERCPDWMDSSKRLGRPTDEGRKWAKENPKAPQPYLCHFCLTGETEVVTREGIFPISALVGKSPELVVPFSAREQPGSRGSFVAAEVHYFGEQSVYAVELRQGRSRKLVRATAEHRWMTSVGERVTADLVAGDRLRPLLSKTLDKDALRLPFAVAQGFVFGDGTHGLKDRRPAVLPIYDMEKDGALLPFFAGCLCVEVGGRVEVRGLPRHWKRVPPLDESRSFLLSWLAGYFAADGTVDARGNPTLCSARREPLEFARSVAAICGVATRPVRGRQRLGYGKTPSWLWSLSLRAVDLPAWFWLIPAHAGRALRERSAAMANERCWVVESVEPAGVEPVYCAVDVGWFALADDLMTGNCPVASSVMVEQRKAKGAYDE